MGIHKHVLDRPSQEAARLVDFFDRQNHSIRHWALAVGKGAVQRIQDTDFDGVPTGRHDSRFRVVWRAGRIVSDIRPECLDSHNDGNQRGRQNHEDADPDAAG